jgi:hypothetical protein
MTFSQPVPKTVSLRSTARRLVAEYRGCTNGNNMNTIKHFVATAATLIVLLGAPARGQVRSPKMPIFIDDPLRRAATLKSAQSQAGQSQTGTFNSIDFPGSVFTEIFANNAQGQAVGIYLDTSFNLHGFVLGAGNFTSIDFPGAAITFLTGINSEGQAVGFYATPTTPLHHPLSFLMGHGVFTTIDFPGAAGTEFNGINPAGDIVGVHFDSISAMHGFVLTRGTFADVDFPGAVSTFAGDNNPQGDIVGSYVDVSGNGHGFLLHQGGFTSIDFPGASENASACFGSGGTAANGINSEGTIVGFYCGADGITNHGFLLSNGNFSTIDVPGALVTFAGDINANGEIVGAYVDASFNVHGFLLTK